jgi:hypothetical protein
MLLPILRSTIAIGWLTIGISAQSGIDFTPATGERVLEGIKFPELYFHENGRKVSYEQPRGWNYSGDAAHIKFVPPDARQAFGEFSQAPLAKPQNFDEETIKLLEAAVVAALPPDSQEIIVVSAEKNPLMINQHETFEVIVAYQLYSDRFQQSVLFMNLPDTQLTFRFVARKSDFEKLHRAFRGSLCSLQWL